MKNQEKKLQALRNKFNDEISVLIVETMESEINGTLDEHGFYLEACALYRSYQGKYVEACHEKIQQV
ncbi:hypothetical protein [Kallipyga gabonensis]|uniref:hypothetical protein n=1 Tax=Kallipyga gabonensis TaxID=1686287 RepID=UPI0006B5CBDA|nr:hypothetical protein [Kallipyga gabonensis]